jgi:hypothetical protein
MRCGVTVVALALTVLCISHVETWADIYTWTDEQGIVHMTDQWDNIPALMRPAVTVRESTPQSDPVRPSSASPLSQEQSESPTPRPQPLQMSPEISETPPASVVPSPSPDYPTLVPNHRPYRYRSKRPDPPFPYNVRLDPFDAKFVWVGPNRVPKDTFTYPKIPLETQRQFRERIRQLEQRRSSGKVLQQQPPGR